MSRMMVVRRDSGEFRHAHITDLPDYLTAGDLVVVNDTRVIPARLLGQKKDTGGKAELLLVEEIDHQATGTAFRCTWKCLYRASGSACAGICLSMADGSIYAEILEILADGMVLVRLTCNKPLFEILEEYGIPPVPPYIKRDNKTKAMIELDRSRYQTVYAKDYGAVAAPTAGLHLTPELLAEMEKSGIQRATVTLHVGLGTFRPVKSEIVEDHVMESERYVVEDDAVKAVNSACRLCRRVVAVGTTTVRTLETVATGRGLIEAGAGRSSIFIYPPYEFKIVNVILTNFHLPKSTLIMMISAFAGKDLIMRAYREAIEMGYRFYSYGDCMLIL